MYESIGKRISYCRNLLGISRPNLVKQIETVSIASINRWELDLVKIPDNQIAKLVDYFVSNGIIVSSEWLKSGTGIVPFNKNIPLIGNYNFDDMAYLTLSNLKNSFPDLEIYTLSSDFFEPVLSYGDYIAGFLTENNDQINQKECFIVQKNAVIVGVYDYKNQQLINFSNHIIKLEHDFKIGEVIWSAKRL